jgi:hypothetical protein
MYVDMMGASGYGPAQTIGDEVDYKTRILFGGAFVAGLSALTQLLFVMTKLPTIFWSDLLGGIFAAVFTAFLFILLRRRRQPAA